MACFNYRLQFELGIRQGQAPHEIGRAQFGRISIANTNSEAIALMDAAFDAAWRAVEEQTMRSVEVS